MSSWGSSSRANAGSPTSAWGGLSLDVRHSARARHDPGDAPRSRRIVREEGRLFHQARLGDEWSDVYEFTLEEMPPIDRELANWFTAAHPQSHFRTRLLVARAAPDGGRLTLLNDELSVRDRTGRAEKHAITSADELLEILAAPFDLSFPGGTRFGPAGANWPT